MLLRLLILPVLLCLSAASVSALEVVPFYTRNQSPLVQIFGLPPADDGAITPEGGIDARLVLDIANNFTGDGNQRELLRLDGEVYRLTLALRYGLTPRLEIGADLPYVRHEGGNFDGLIDGFHRAFSMPEGGREGWHDNYLRYVAVYDGETELWLDTPSSGFGDLLLSAGWQLYRDPSPRPRAFSLRAGLKLPTGEADRLTGSGSTDLSLWFAGTDPASLGNWNVTWYWNAGGLWMSDGDVLPRRQRNLVGFGTLGIGWNPVSWWALKLQFDGHTPFYGDSDLDQLSSSSIQVVFGSSFSLPGKVLFDIGVSEDLVVNTAPDAVFHFALRRRF